MRKALFDGDRRRGFERFELSPDKTTLLVFGGSLGARTINLAIRAVVDELAPEQQVIHVCGAGNLDDSLQGHPRYRQYEYLREEFPDALECAELVICRAGANSIAEVTALKIPAVLVPLSPRQSRGDQLENAREFVGEGFGWMVQDDDLGPDSLLSAIAVGLHGARTAIQAMGPSDNIAAEPAMRTVYGSGCGTSRERCLDSDPRHSSLHDDLTLSQDEPCDGASSLGPRLLRHREPRTAAKATGCARLPAQERLGVSFRIFICTTPISKKGTNGGFRSYVVAGP